MMTRRVCGVQKNSNVLVSQSVFCPMLLHESVLLCSFSHYRLIARDSSLSILLQLLLDIHISLPHWDPMHHKYELTEGFDSQENETSLVECDEENLYIQYIYVHVCIICIE